MMYAEDINYWKTGKSNAGAWLEKAKQQIIKLGGHVLIQAEGMNPDTGNEIYMLHFMIDNENYKILWPVLPTRTSTQANQRAAKIQAATMLYHDVKARCITAAVLGSRKAFFAYYMLPDGRAAADAGNEDIARLFDAFSGRTQIESGEIVDGDIE
jgi:hypothetical protein